MDAMEAPNVSVGSADAAGGGGDGSFPSNMCADTVACALILGSSSTSAPSYNPQATVSEGLNTVTVTTQSLPILPAIPSIPAVIPRPSARTQTFPSLLRGPTPQKGSGQDRFLQLLKGNDQSCLTTVAQSNPLAAPTSMTQRLLTAQHYPPGVAQINPSLLTFHTTPTCPGNQETDRVITPSEAKAKMPAPLKAELKESTLAAPKLVIGDSHGQSSRQTVGVGANGQNRPVATARLSAECQRRHFNPKWHESSGPNGFKCSVQLINKVIHGGHAYPNAYDAKQAVAEKALVYVSQLPCEDPLEKAAAKIQCTGKADRFSACNRPARSQVKREPTTNAGNGSFYSQYTNRAPDANAAAYNWNTFDQRTLLHRIQSVFGCAGPSPAVLADPLAAQAFLQGLAVGTSIRVASSVYEPYLEPRGRPLPVISGEIYRPYEARERSPRPNFIHNYRERSPLRQRTPYESKTRRSG
ncbi:hypothetical protein F4680DRAFT_445153 [Xylaria scruposa]|nr:hypothetical protein F4680DRAFT_445153 [Xylaria scruposa]